MISRIPRRQFSPASTTGRVGRSLAHSPAQHGIAAFTLAAFLTSSFYPAFAFAQAPDELSPSPEAALPPPSASPPSEGAQPDSAATVDTAPSTTADTDDKTQDALLDHIKDEAGIKDDGAEGVTTSLDGVVRANAVLPTADSSGVTGKQISIPKGEGTIKGMEESFSAQLSTGIATFTVPVELPGARGKVQPSLSLAYSSSSGLGLPGMGWSMGVPFIARQTDRGLPKYDDRVGFHPEQDNFVFNGGQELVPICTVGVALECEGALQGLDPPLGATNLIPIDEVMPEWAAGWQYFRPRVEGSPFLRFFWSPNHQTWRLQDTTGATMELGVPLNDPSYREATEANPEQATQIFRWHLVRQYDLYGDTQTNVPLPKNGVVYRYAQDSGQAYLTDIYSTPPASEPEAALLSQYAQHTRLVYETRPDRTQSYRSGWLMQQSLRPVRIDITSKSFDGNIDSRRELVRRYHLQYDQDSHVTLLASVQIEGRCADTTGLQLTENSSQSLSPSNCPRMPPLQFEYTRVAGHLSDGTATTSSLPGYEPFDERLLSVDQSPPHSLDEEQTMLMDVNGDSLQDVLVTAAGVYGGKHGVFVNGANGAITEFEEQRIGVQGVLGANANVIKLSNLNVVPLDIDGDGLANLLHMPMVKTYAVYDPTFNGDTWNWAGRTITTASNNNPKVDLGNDTRDIKVVDVNFDGLVDVVASQGTEFQTFFALGRYPTGDGQFGTARRTGKETANISNDPARMCVPWHGTPLRLSDSDTELADMNGDGITDIVRLRRGDIHYWPGRGNGYWGTGKLDDCPEGTFDQEGDLAMASSPFYTDIQGNSLRLEDVNGDGLSDLVQVNSTDVSVWLNIDGTGWTARRIINDTPVSPAYANRVRLTDVNASGTLDILWGDGNSYKYIDLAGGVRPHLLQRVHNGLGKTTEITYGTSAQEMLDAKKANRPWSAKMPTLVQLVKRVAETDNLTIAGRPPATYVTEYTYRDPVYEGRQREFRGFREAEAKRIGDSNSPTSTTRSVFLLGECRDETTNGIDDCSNSERWRDNPREALKGLPVVSETHDGNGIFLSTTHNKYTLRHLYDGLDGRAVRHAFMSETDTYLYDTASFTPTSTETTTTVAHLEKQENGSFTSDGFEGLSEQARVPIRSTLGAVQTRSAVRVDAFGNRTHEIKSGALGQDEVITATSVPERIAEPSGWLWRTVRSFVVGSQHAQQARKDVTRTHDAQGAVIRTDANLLGSLPLVRDVDDTATRHPLRSVDAVVTLTENQYDAFGNLVVVEGVGQRASEVTYDATYQQLPVEETVYAGPQSLSNSSASGIGSNPLTTTAEYDRGYESVTASFDANDQPAAFVYDHFGRLIELFRPDPESTTPSLSPKPSMRFQYMLPPTSGQHHSIIHTETQDGEALQDESYRESWTYFDGLGRTIVTLSEAEPESGAMQSTNQRWIASDLMEWDQKNNLRRKYLAAFYEGDPTIFDFGTKPKSRYGRQRYDAFSRQFQTFDVDGTVTLQNTYHALTTDLWDAADLEPGGQHAGTFATARKDGHDRPVETTERFRVDGILETRQTRTQYLPTGDPEIIRRTRGSTGEEVTSWFVYDSLGRMVLNVEPHTSVDYQLNPNPNQDFNTDYSNISAWRYAYNDAGDLVGTSDARGCGTNYFFDGAGRLAGEDFFPCESHHSAYSEPDTTSSSSLTGNGLEIHYEYDAATETECQRTQTFLKGRIARIRDQGRTRITSYDARGRSPWTAVRVAKPGTISPTMSERFAPRCYVKEQTFDSADRPTKETTGAKQHLGSNSESAVSFLYSERGTIKAVTSSYGGNQSAQAGQGVSPNLVSDIVRTADSLVERVEYGDLARTSTTYTYDERRRVQSVVTSRAPPDTEGVWPPDYDQSPATFQLLLQDEEYGYDVVNNPTEIRDWRIAEEWPAGAKPVTRRIDYDDLNRASRIDYEYAAGDDAWQSPFAAENQSSEGDPRRADPSPHASFPKRILSQSYRYDWLGNHQYSDDDTKGFYDRSLGTIVNGEANPGGARKVPNQIRSANQTGPSGGNLQTRYDAVGNLTRLFVARSGTCLPTGASCDQWFEYEWDEAGRLNRARRWDGQNLAAADVDTAPVPGGAPAADLNYRYDARDNRVLKTAVDASSNELHTVYVFASLELRRAPFIAEGDPADDDFLLDDLTEVPYLFANGVLLGRVHFEPDMDPDIGTPTAGQGQLRVFFELGDHLGSTSVVLDKATSELVERSTFQAYGGAESDYRPARWGSFREDYRFTGKEEDVEVGLQYFGRRYLNPLLGRWISPDPLAIHSLGGDPNAYAYVSGTVLKNVDPLGLQCPTGNCHQSNNSSTAFNFEQFDKIGNYTDGTAAPPPPPPAPANPEHTALKQKFEGAVKAGGTSAAAAGVGFKFGVAAGEVPYVGAAASWLIAYMVEELGPEQAKFGFGAGLAASSVPLAIQAAGEFGTAASMGIGGLAIAGTGVGAPAGGAVEVGAGAVAVHAGGVAINAASNAGAGAWLMAKGPSSGGGSSGSGGGKPSAANDGPEHHIMTDKNSKSTARGGPWTPRFEDMANRAGMTLDDPLNRVRIPGHKGPHPEAYHKAVFDRLARATEGPLSPEAYAASFRAELAAIRTEVTTVGSALHKLLVP